MAIINRAGLKWAGDSGVTLLCVTGLWPYLQQTHAYFFIAVDVLARDEKFSYPKTIKNGEFWVTNQQIMATIC